MFSTDERPEIWLSMKSSRVATFAFGKSASRRSSAWKFASVSPPRTCTNE